MALDYLRFEPDLARVSNVFGGKYVVISEARQPENIEDPLVFTNSGDFMATSITVSQIPASCQNKIFRVKVYGNNGADPLTVAKFDSISPDGFVDIWWGSGYRPSSPGVSDLQIPTGYAVIDFQNGLWTGRSTDGIGSNGNPLHPFLLTSATPDTTFTQTNAFKYILPLSVHSKDIYKITLESLDGLLPASYGYPKGSTYYDFYKPTS